MARDLQTLQEYQLELLDKLSIATCFELRTRRLSKLKADAETLSAILKSPPALDDSDVREVNLEEVAVELKAAEAKANGISAELTRVWHQQALVLDDLILYPEIQASSLDWVTAHEYGGSLISWFQVTRTVTNLTDIPRRNRLLLDRKQEKEARQKEERERIHPALSELDGLRDRLCNISKRMRGLSVPNEVKESGRAGSAASDKTLVPTPENTSPIIFQEHLSLAATPAPLPASPDTLVDDAFRFRFTKMLDEAQRLQDVRTSDEARLSSLESEVNIALEIASTPACTDTNDPPPPTIHDVTSHITHLVTAEIQALLSSDLHFVPSKDLLDVNTTYNELAERMADANKLLCKLMITSPDYAKEEGEIESERGLPLVE